uniref:Uncharacterized protein n=2 Tax=Oryza TaxID=4527 RepID=Q2R987_ORYSJ|nr:hypothetical protein LOC_Os11g09610 [Oryza sativa Japonica Group]
MARVQDMMEFMDHLFLLRGLRAGAARHARAQDFDSLRWTTCLLSISRHLKRLELVSHSANQQILRLLELLGAGTSED